MYYTLSCFTIVSLCKSYDMTKPLRISQDNSMRLISCQVVGDTPDLSVVARNFPITFATGKPVS